jgi:CDI immunity proteins
MSDEQPRTPRSDSGRFASYAQLRERSLDELEPIAGDVTGEITGESSVVAETKRLRGVPLKQLRIEDLRLLIGQGMGIPFLVPMAVAHLEEHPLAAGDFHPGDLLKQVVGVGDEYWGSRRELRGRLVTAIRRALERIGKTSAPADLEPTLRAALERHAGALRQR